MKVTKEILTRLTLSFLAAALGIAAVTCHGIFAWFCFLPFFIAVRNLSPKRAAKYGAFAGAVIGAILFVGFRRYGLGIIFVISLYTMCSGILFGLATGWIGKNAFKGLGLLFLPMVWVTLEFARTLSPISIPSNLAISQYQNLPLIQIASITGAYGISFIIVLVNCLVYRMLKTLLFNRHCEPLTSLMSRARNLRHRDCFVGLSGLLAMTVIFVSTIALYYSSPMKANTPSSKNGIKVAIVQGGIPIELYRDVNKDPRAKEVIRETYFGLTRRVKEKGADLIVWPEGVLGEYAMQDAALKRRLEAIPKQHKAYFMAGMPSVAKDGTHNTVYTFSPSGKLIGQYDKMHLVPYFEEYKPGKRSPVINTKLGKFGMAICFESIYPEIVRNLVKKDAEILFILTNDAGFGHSKLVDLHAREAIFRAVETKRYVVRAAQSGISMFIDPMGKVLKRSKEFEKTILTGAVKLRFGLTFYARYGDIFAYLCIVGCGAMFVIKKRKIK